MPLQTPDGSFQYQYQTQNSPDMTNQYYIQQQQFSQYRQQIPISVGNHTQQASNQNKSYRDVLNQFHLPFNIPRDIFSHYLMTASDVDQSRFKNATARGPWIQVEDDLLLKAFSQTGPVKWTVIAKIVGTRSPKQCRERWSNCLQPALKRSPFEPWEDEIIISKQQELGNHWAAIAKSLPGPVKNRWYTTLRNTSNYEFLWEL